MKEDQAPCQKATKCRGENVLEYLCRVLRKQSKMTPVWVQCKLSRTRLCSWTGALLQQKFFKMIFRPVWPDVIQAALFRSLEQAKHRLQHKELLDRAHKLLMTPLSGLNGVLRSVVKASAASEDHRHGHLTEEDGVTGGSERSPECQRTVRIKGIFAAELTVKTLLMGNLRRLPEFLRMFVCVSAYMFHVHAGPAVIHRNAGQLWSIRNEHVRCCSLPPLQLLWLRWWFSSLFSPLGV